MCINQTIFNGIPIEMEMENIHSTILMVRHSFQSNLVTFTMDTLASSFSIVLPSQITCFEMIHPDRWALILILVLYPILEMDSSVCSCLQLSFEISEQFALQFQGCGYEIIPYNAQLNPVHDSNSNPNPDHNILCFGGGIHSTVSAIVLGIHTPLIHMANRTNLAKSERILYLLDVMKYNGFSHCKMILTDIEDFISSNALYYQRPHYTFYHAIGCILFSELYETNVINFGYTMNEVSLLHATDYCNEFFINQCKLGFHTWDDSPNFSQLYFWQQLFQTCGLTLQFPLSSISWIVSLLIGKTCAIGNDIHLCNQLTFAGKCGQCSDCFMEETILHMYTLLQHSSHQGLGLGNLTNVLNHVYKNSKQYGAWKWTGKWSYFWLFLLKLANNTWKENEEFQDLMIHIHQWSHLFTIQKPILEMLCSPSQKVEIYKQLVQLQKKIKIGK